MWQVYGFMHPWRDTHYGPLPRKRWIRKSGEKYKLRYKWRVPRGSFSSEEWTNRAAITYATWLAARDGIVLPAYNPRAIRSGFYSAYRTRMQRRWNGVNEIHLFIHRVQAVAWGYEEDRYAERKDGERGAWIGKEFIEVLRIDIPYWDFEHPPIAGIVCDSETSAH